jgi:uncharacterized membrane protein YuzA (DUF378 family)
VVPGAPLEENKTGNTTAGQENQMSVPGFRVLTYAGLGLSVACLHSPFGWGFTHPPFPSLNVILSLGFYSVVVIAGLRTIKTIWELAGATRWIFLFLASCLLIIVGFFGVISLLFQQTSAHYQNVTHTFLIIYVLIALAGIASIQLAAEKTIKKRRQS